MLPVYHCLTNKPKLSSQPIKRVSHSKAEADWAFKGLGRAIKWLCFQIKIIDLVGRMPSNTS